MTRFSSFLASALAATQIQNIATLASPTTGGTQRSQFPKRVGTGNDSLEWNPPANMTKSLADVWDYEASTYSEFLTYRNYGFDQLMANGGYVNYCVRWESNLTLNASTRARFQTALQRSHDHWMSWLFGWDFFPFKSVKVNIVGWAVYNETLLEGDVEGTIYTNTDPDGIPECDQGCGRLWHQDDDYSQCPGGDADHFNYWLWLSESFGDRAGTGSDWGQRIGRQYFYDNLENDTIHILQHEMGHTYCLADFYTWHPEAFPNFIMRSGTSFVVTDFDGWMLRDWWRNLRSRYDIRAQPGAQCGGQPYDGPKKCTDGYTCKKKHVQHLHHYAECAPASD